MPDFCSDMFGPGIVSVSDLVKKSDGDVSKFVVIG